MNGVQIGTVGAVGDSGCTIIFQEIDLAQNPIAQGQVLYLLVQTNVSLTKTGISLVMDGGNGVLQRATDSDCRSVGAWELHTFQLTMGLTGTARFGMEVFSTHPAAARASVAVEIGAVVLAPVGQAWDRLKTDDSEPRAEHVDEYLAGTPEWPGASMA